jgi:RNA polymerase sigma-70 factor (ECF subfamily)
MATALTLDLDGELVTRVASGDSMAFETLYRRHAAPLRRLALRKLGDAAEAEDAVQETFTSLWRGAAGYRAERGQGRPWLYGVARNAVYDRLRRRRPLLSSELLEVVDPASSTAQRVELGLQAARVHEGVRQLPPAQRELIALAYWGGLSQSEIALQLGLPLGTVKTRTRAALRSLAELLEEADDD